MTKTKFKRELADNIRDARMAKGLTQRELAQQIGLSAAAVGYYETGDRLPNIMTLSVLSQIFDESLDSLVPRMELEASVDPNQMSMF